MVEALRALPKEEQRFAVILTHALREVAAETDISEDRIRNILYRLVQAGQLQERRAPEARNELARALGPSLADLDPVPYATVEQARRLSALRSSLLRQGAFSTAKIAEGDAIPIRLNDTKSFENTGTTPLEFLIVGVVSDNARRMEILQPPARGGGARGGPGRGMHAAGQ